MSNISSLTPRSISGQQGRELDTLGMNDPLARLADRVNATLNPNSSLVNSVGNQPGQDVNPDQVRDFISGISPVPLPGQQCSYVV